MSPLGKMSSFRPPVLHRLIAMDKAVILCGQSRVERSSFREGAKDGRGVLELLDGRVEIGVVGVAMNDMNGACINLEKPLRVELVSSIQVATDALLRHRGTPQKARAVDDPLTTRRKAQRPIFHHVHKSSLFSKAALYGDEHADCFAK